MGRIHTQNLIHCHKFGAKYILAVWEFVISGKCSSTHDGKVPLGAESGQLLDASLPPITSRCICTMPGKKVAANWQPAAGKQKHSECCFCVWQCSSKLISNSHSLSLLLPLSPTPPPSLSLYLHLSLSFSLSSSPPPFFAVSAGTSY